MESSYKQKSPVIFSPSVYPCEIGGMEIFNYFLFKKISSAQKVFLISTCVKVDSPNIIKINQRLFIFRKYGLGKLSIIISSIYQLIKNRHIISIIDVPYTLDCGYYAIIFPILKKMLRLNYIITIHSGEKIRPTPFYLHKYLFKHAKKVVGVSSRIKKDFEQYFNRDVSLILPLLPIYYSEQNKSSLRRRYGFNLDDNILVYLGSIKELKGCDLIYNAFKILLNEYNCSTKLKLLYVGKEVGNLRKELIKKASDDKIIGINVFFIDGIPYEKTSEIYKIADQYIMSSKYEGTPISLLGAMYHSLPILASDVRGINFIINNLDNGLLFEFANIQDMAKKMQLLIENNELSVQLGKKAKQDYHRLFDFEKNLDSIIDSYND